MAKKRNKYDLQHDANVKKYQMRLDRIFNAALRECAAIGATISDFDPSKPFAFKDYPITRKRLRDLLNELTDGIEAVVVNAVREEWDLSNAKNDALVEQVLGKKAAELPAEIRRRYFSTNAEAEKAFLARKASGLNLSDRVWNYSNQFKEEIEMGLDLGIRDGLSADEMSRQLRKYLKEPNRLFRRVRDEHGNLHLSKAAKAYHPGRGVYRSSYKNARRLTATESNIAYRSADYERWQQLDFVVGIRVVLSNNHPVDDICNDLSAKQGSTAKTGRGCYPKDFKFTGWHPHCRCHVETILKTEEEMDRDTECILNGEEPSQESVNKVEAMPENFSKWVTKNQERIENAKSLPYWIKDNKKAVEKLIDKETPPSMLPKMAATTVSDKTKVAESRQAANRKEYERLLKDENYRDVVFNEENGGLKATHIRHNFDGKKGWYEENVRDVGFKEGNAIVLKEEIHTIQNKRNTEGTWNGMMFEIAAAETATKTNIRNALKHCAKKPGTEVAVIFFPAKEFNERAFLEGLSMFNGLPENQYKKFKIIYCLSKDRILYIKKPE